MKAILFFVAFFIATTTFSQNAIDATIFESLPQNLELKDELQKFEVTTLHFNGDIFGNFFNKIQIKGEYTRGLENGNVKWNNVSVATSMQRDGNFAAGTQLDYMENYSYAPTADMLKPENFVTFKENSAYAKNLVWDMLGIEGFAWSFFDKLKLNEPYSAEEMNEKMSLAEQGYFENKNVIITWTGVSKYNDELCATIEFRTLDNPLEYSEEAMSMRGRSHYWGTIWVSLEDKQIEHANLFEDVMMEMNLAGQSPNQLMNATREVTFKKVL